MRDKKVVAEFNEWADRNKIHNCMRKGMWEAFKRDYPARKFEEVIRKTARASGAMRKCFLEFGEKQALLAVLSRGVPVRRINGPGEKEEFYKKLRNTPAKEENLRTKKMHEIFEERPPKVDVKNTFCLAEGIYEKGKIVGLFLAWKPKKTNYILFGYSLCHPVDEFSWDKAVGVAIEKMAIPLNQYHKEMPEKIIKKWGCFYRKVRLSLGSGFTYVCYPFVVINCEKFIRQSLPVWLQKELRLEKSCLEKETKQTETKQKCHTQYFTEVLFSQGELIFREKLKEKPATGSFFEVIVREHHRTK